MYPRNWIEPNERGIGHERIAIRLLQARLVAHGLYAIRARFDERPERVYRTTPAIRRT